MSSEYEQYKNKMNQNIEERRENTLQIQPKAKNPMDNSSSILYNKGSNKMENTGIMKPVPLRNFTSQWKQKNQDVLKYAGDSTKESVNKGLEEANSFMKDADESTSFEKVQDASVKWRLAHDSNNQNLLKKAQHEMIGHLSKENKNTYLKNLLPLQDYIDAKDEFDYKNNNYTTTRNLDTTPDEDVRALQRRLNEKGYTDKFGNKLKEDGIYGGKTAFALDELEKNVRNSPIKNEHASKENTLNEDLLRIANSIGYTEEDLDVVALVSNDEGEFLIPSKYASANKKSEQIFRPINLYEHIFQGEFWDLIKYGTGTEKKNNPYQTYRYIEKKAAELELPLELCLATVFKESSFRNYKQDENGKITINEKNGDYGLMQININAHPQAFNDKQKYGDIINNWHDNIDYGLSFLKECYEDAKNQKIYIADDLLKATYSNYNSGSCRAYKNPNHDAYQNVNGFWDVYTNKEWLKVVNIQ